jgi:hypothetical protein
MSQNDEDDDETVNEEKQKEQPISLAELSQLEEEASRKVMNRLTMPSRIGNAITSMGWAFVISGSLLGAFGYCYTIDEQTHLIKIDTLEHRMFQVELRKGGTATTRATVSLKDELPP